MLIYLSLLVSVIGAAFYLLSKDPKRQELGRLAFACGLLAFLFGYHGQGISLFHS